MRRGKIFNLKWFDIDFDCTLIQVRESKTNKKRLVPINTIIRTLLNSLKRISEYVFQVRKQTTDWITSNEVFVERLNWLRLRIFAFTIYVIRQPREWLT